MCLHPAYCSVSLGTPIEHRWAGEGFNSMFHHVEWGLDEHEWLGFHDVKCFRLQRSTPITYGDKERVLHMHTHIHHVYVYYGFPYYAIDSMY